MSEAPQLQNTKTDNLYKFYFWSDGTVTASFDQVWAEGVFESEEAARKAIAEQFELSALQS